MGDLYLNSGESIILTANKVSVNFVPFDIILTNQRLIFIDSTYARFEPQMIPLGDIFSVKEEKIATGEPVISLTLAASGAAGTHDSMDLLFTQQPGERRKPESNEWLRKLMENIVAIRQKTGILDALPHDQDTGMRPTVRRWIAPEILQPHKVVVPRSDSNASIPRSSSQKESAPASAAIDSSEKEHEPVGEPALPDQDKVPEQVSATEETPEISLDERLPEGSKRSLELPSMDIPAGKTTAPEEENPVPSRSMAEESLAGSDSERIGPGGESNTVTGPRIQSGEIEGERASTRPVAVNWPVIPVKREEETQGSLPVIPDTDQDAEITEENAEPVEPMTYGTVENEPPSTILVSPDTSRMVNWPVIPAKREEKTDLSVPVLPVTEQDTGIAGGPDEREKSVPGFSEPPVLNEAAPAVPERLGTILIGEDAPVTEENPEPEGATGSGYSGPGTRNAKTTTAREETTRAGVRGVVGNTVKESNKPAEPLTGASPAPDEPVAAKSSETPGGLKPDAERAIPKPSDASSSSEMEPPKEDSHHFRENAELPPAPPRTSLGESPENANGAAGFPESLPVPDKKERRYGHGAIAGMIIVIVVILALLGTAVFLSHDMTAGTTTQVPTVTETPVINQTPTQSPVIIPKTGLWVRVIYDRHYYGWVGNPGDLAEVSGTGDTFYPIRNSDKLVQVSIQKQDNSGDLLTVMIFRNGTMINQESTRVPRDEISNLIDPATGKPPTTVTSGNR